MCKFFSCISDGEGNVKHFDPKDVIEIMIKGNPENYDFNSHTSYCHFKGIKGLQEDKWNKWEYNPSSKKLKSDNLATNDDTRKVKKYLESWFKDKDILYLSNLFGRNSGYCNSGDCNSGDRNSGDWNSGYKNSGNRNSGYRNSGDCNSGDKNSGDRNSGNRNSGYYNSGDCNSGDCNSGDCNLGYRNLGDWNSGNRNSGDWNSGDCNSGNKNSGDRNSGDWNSGNRNSGNRNSGDWNSADYSNGVFCTKEEKIFIFDKPSNMTLREWTNSTYILLFSNFRITEWIKESEMTNKEKKDNPNFHVQSGYLKKIEYKDACKNWWNSLTKKQKKDVCSIPNFDKKIFKKITGISV